jgi:hypothetical protein
VVAVVVVVASRREAYAAWFLLFLESYGLVVFWPFSFLSTTTRSSN